MVCNMCAFFPPETAQCEFTLGHQDNNLSYHQERLARQTFSHIITRLLTLKPISPKHHHPTENVLQINGFIAVSNDGDIRRATKDTCMFTTRWRKPPSNHLLGNFIKHIYTFHKHHIQYLPSYFEKFNQK